MRKMRLFLFGPFLLLIAACPLTISPMAIFQNAIASNVSNQTIVRIVDCNKPNEYSFRIVDNLDRKKGDGQEVRQDLDIVIGQKIVATIELPNSEAKNFAVNSVEKTNIGFEVRVNWGGGVYHYEIQFNFRCKDNNFYLYKVKNENFSTTNPDSGSFLDKKKTKITKIEPNLLITKFVMLDYLE